MGDSYRPPPPRDRDVVRGDAGFSFRGAVDTYRPQAQHRPEEQFTFSAPSGPAAPRFPAQQPPPRGPQSNRHGADKRRYRGRGGRQQGGPPFRRVPKPAHAREILKHKERETTPEQMIGMNNDGHARFMDTASDSEDGEADDDGGDSGNPEGDAGNGDGDNDGARKRVKSEDGTAASARPQWSNPDPYSVLPPTDLGLQPKKDIVKTIRKAKVEVSDKKSSTNAIKENADFISFDFDDEKESEDDEDNNGYVPPPTGPPTALWMPTDQELMKTYGNSEPRGTKRKHVDDVPSKAGTIVTEWKAIDGSDPTPWLRRDQKFIASKGLQLHMEIVDFYDFVRPYSHEADIRRDLIARIETAVRASPLAAGKDVRIRSFGSFASNLYLPVADMDLVAVSGSFEERGRPSFCHGKQPTPKHQLANHLIRWGVPKQNSMIVVAKSKVPILKFVDAETDIKVDISFENDSGLRAIRTFEAWKEQYPEMPALVMIIKQFLAMRGLNEVVDGGLGGFSIICLVVSMLQLMPENQRSSLDSQSRYGQLLLNFFDLYGNKFNLRETGITMSPAGYFNKQVPGACNAKKINFKGLTIVDPNRSDNDISGGSRKVGLIFEHFRGALHEIQNQLSRIANGQARDPSILGCILGGNYTSFEKQREILKDLDRGQNNPSSPRLARQPQPPATSYYPEAPTPRLARETPAPASSYYPPPPPPGLARQSQPQASSYYPPPAPPAQYPQYPWQNYSQEAPPPARGGHYYAPQNAYAFQPPGPPPSQPPQPWQQSSSYQPLPAPPPPSSFGSGQGSQPTNGNTGYGSPFAFAHVPSDGFPQSPQSLPPPPPEPEFKTDVLQKLRKNEVNNKTSKQSKRAKKKARKAQNATSSSMANADQPPKSKSEKKKEREDRTARKKRRDQQKLQAQSNQASQDNKAKSKKNKKN